MKLRYLLAFLPVTIPMVIQGHSWSLGSLASWVGYKTHREKIKILPTKFDYDTQKDQITVKNWVIDSKNWDTKDSQDNKWFDPEFLGSSDYSNSYSWQISKWFQSTKVTDALKAEDFEYIQFKTEDNYELEGYIRKVDNPDFSITFCAGWMPGRFTGMSTFVKMMPKNCNILFYNARGKGKSTGLSTLLNVFNYGINEYKDVIAAVELLHKAAPEKPIFLHGICVGSYHAARAVIELAELNKIQEYKIQGLVIDSGFDSIRTMSQTMPNAILGDNNWKSNAFNKLHSWFYNPKMTAENPNLTLKDKLCKAGVPVFFIHSTHDQYAPCNSVDTTTGQVCGIQTVIQQMPAELKAVWFVEYDGKDTANRHGTHHLKWKYTYCEKLLQFIADKIK